MILLHHGVFTFGETADESYNRMLEIVGLAEKYLKENSVSSGLPGPEKNSPG
jgi:rhamnose utilization protein RhaD (predicted bifunctional aldolase and dehydrogenase)